MKRNVLVIQGAVFAVLMCASIYSYATTYTTAQDGNWNTFSTWENGVKPTDKINIGDTVFIYHDINYNLTKDLTVNQATFYLIGGSLNFQAGLDNSINFNQSTVLIIGSELILPIDDGISQYDGQLNSNQTYFEICGSHIEIAEEWEFNQNSVVYIYNSSAVLGSTWEKLNQSTFTMSNTCLDMGIYQGGDFYSNQGILSMENSSFRMLSASGDFDVHQGWMIGGANAVENLLVPGDLISDFTVWTAEVQHYCVGGSVIGVPVIYLPLSEECGLVQSNSCSQYSPDPLSVSCNVITPATCELSDGIVQATVSGGVSSCQNLSGYSYEWSSGHTTATVVGLPAGTYTVTVTDLGGATETCTVVLNDILCPGAAMGAVMDEVYDGVPDVKIYLLDSDGDTIAQTFTLNVPFDLDGDGNDEGIGYYIFTGLMPGNYNIIEIQPFGYVDMMEMDGGDDNDNADNGIPNNIPVTITSGELDLGNDFIETYVLPINLIKFTANLDREQVRLEWQATGDEGERMEVMFSQTGMNSDYISVYETTVPMSGELITYSATHENPVPGLNYYRLRMTDSDGHVHYSSIRVVSIEDLKTSLNVSIYPNPVRDMLYIDLGTTTVTDHEVRFFDHIGRLVYVDNAVTLGVEGTLYGVDMSLFDHGVYLLEVSTRTSRHIQKVVVHR